MGGVPPLRKDASPAERRQWLDAFKESAPDNALPSYLSALDYFKAGQTDQAVQELLVASGKQRFHDYSLDRVQDDEEAYRAAGYSVAEAKGIAVMHLLLPQLPQMRDLSRSVIELAQSYQQAGDEPSRQAALQIGADLGRRYGTAAPGESLVSQLVGISVERMALAAMDPNAAYGGDGETVQQRLGQLAQHRTGIRDLTTQADTVWQTVAEQDWISYYNRFATFGEESALRWLVNKYGGK